MQKKEFFPEKNDIHCHILRSGNRTYFFNVKKTQRGEYYITITESKKYISEKGIPTYKKHKLFLYKEDFLKFQKALKEIFQFITEKN